MYRAELLQRLQLPFTQQNPVVDESLLEHESAQDYVLRLAQSKAQAIATEHAEALVIGSDQCAVLEQMIIGKPADHDAACQQLLNASGKTVVFETAVCLYRHSDQFFLLDRVPFSVKFRKLSLKQIEHYLEVDQPYNCAGSFKSEAFGITLFENMQGSDPTALIGLPLIRLTAMLEQAGIEVL